MSKSLAELYLLWDKLGDIQTSEGYDEVEVDTIEEPFLHFPVGTHREDIWHWFEAQNPDFIVGEVMYGKRRECAESWQAIGIGENFVDETDGNGNRRLRYTDGRIVPLQGNALDDIELPPEAAKAIATAVDLA